MAASVAKGVRLSDPQGKRSPTSGEKSALKKGGLRFQAAPNQLLLLRSLLFASRYAGVVLGDTGLKTSLRVGRPEAEPLARVFLFCA